MDTHDVINSENIDTSDSSTKKFGNQVGKIQTNGKANGCPVYIGPRGGVFYLNNDGNTVPLTDKTLHKVVFY